MMKKNLFSMKIETITGQVVGKANNYMAVPDGCVGRRIIKNDAIRQYERSFLRQCVVYKKKLIDRPFCLHIIVYHSSNRYDLDNSLKTVLDCLQYAKAIKDDKLCVRINAEKRIDRNNPRIVFHIEELEPNLFH